MVKSFFSILFVSCSLMFAAVAVANLPKNSTPPQEQATSQPQHQNGPLRSDKLDDQSPYALQKLQRGERILSTLVFDPQNYHLILSDKTCFGGEAVPPYVYSSKPSIILYQGALSPNRSNEEIAFMMAHELGHLNLHHMEKMNQQMEQIFSGPPVGISGTTFIIYKQKLQEQEADMFGLHMYKHAGYSLSFFPRTLALLQKNPNIHYGSNRLFKSTEVGSLSMKDTHFKMSQRFELLVKECQAI